MTRPGYRFGLEGEYLLVKIDTFQPLWLHDLRFEQLNAILEGIDFQPLLAGLTLEGLELDPPHRKLMPYYVEGYAIANADLTTYVDVLPKGIEIRTPVCADLETCLGVYENLYQGLQRALANEGYRAVALAHHPEAWHFEGPQNHQRIDWWIWAMRVTTTYGPDLNLSPLEENQPRFNWNTLQRRANYYGPALVAFSLNAPIKQGCLWEPHGRPGLSVRTFRRSPFAPMLAWHPKEGGRVEFKSFDMPTDRRDFHLFFLLWLWLRHDVDAPREADDQERIYDLGQIARFGWEAEAVVERAEEALDRAAVVLAQLEVDPGPLELLRRRLEQRLTPAHALIRQFKSCRATPDLMHCLDAVAESKAGTNGSAPAHGSALVRGVIPAHPIVL